MLEIIKYTVIANLEEEGTILHKELDFLTEEEADAYILENGSEYTKTPVWKEKI